ncbi:MAG: hypothetical protein F4069_04950 [Rhodothermaceae bacterium]|nr:hypothetical protein [Rhodothermaceae bacterium]
MRISAIFALLVFFIAACGGGASETDVSQESGSDDAAETVAVTPMGSGGVSGSVMFTGTPAERTPVRMNDDCTDERDTEALSEDLLVNDGAVQNVFVYVSAGLPDGYAYPTPSEPAVMDQEGCMYVPRVMGLQIGQTNRVSYSDPFQHNVHPVPEENRGFNESTPGIGDYLEKTFLVPEVMISVKCDVHSWMQAYIGVLDHPYFATTDAGGSFMISGLPDGDYTLTAWHEQLGEQTMAVTVADGAMADASISYQ